MIGLILAAGFGTRLKPLTEHIPKSLVTVCGIPLLERNLDFLNANGIGRIAVNSHYLPEQIQSFKDTSAYTFTLFHEKDQIRGTGGALDFAREFLSSDEGFCIVNADILSNVNIREESKKFEESGDICALVAAPALKKGTVFLDPDSKEYKGIPSEVPDGSNAVGADFIGMTFYRRKILDYITEDDFSIIPIWKRIQEKGHSVKVYVQENIRWYDTGTPLSLARIHFDMLDGLVSLDTPDNMHIDFNKKVAYPNDLTKEKQSALKEYSWVESDMIARTAVITRSIVLEESIVHERETVTDTIHTKWGGIPFEQ
jgi:NDP-sugar pyrophosphorylase family protein